MTADLRRLAEQATPGPWTVSHNGKRWLVADSSSMGFAVAGAMSRGKPLDEKGQANAAYIAAANPQRIIELLNRLEACERDHG